MKQHPRILFYGTPEFAVASLKAVLDAGYNVAGVVTAPDRLAGRGLKQTMSPVKCFALEHNLKLLQPVNLKDMLFLGDLRSLNPDLQVVVAFRMLPTSVWSIPPMGTFNLHASLLPQYRGAAPINRAIINGDEVTGVTTFMIDDKIDTGKIIFRQTVPIRPDETAGELHDRLMETGAGLVVKTIGAIESGNITMITQDPGPGDHGQFLKPAPKIMKEDCRIDWGQNSAQVFNFIRGLSPYPTAYTELTGNTGEAFHLKVFRSDPEISRHSLKPSEYICDGRTYLKVAVRDGFIYLRELQPAGRRAMDILEFLKGYGRNFS